MAARLLPLFLTLCALLSLSPAGHAQTEVAIRAVWSIDPTQAKPGDHNFIVIKPYLKSSTSIYKGRLFQPTDPRLDAGNFTLTAGGKAVSFKVLPPDDSPGFMVKIVPQETPTADKDYTLLIKQPFHLVNAGELSISPYANVPIVLSKADLQRNLAYNQTSAPNKIALTQGKTGALSFEATYNHPLSTPIHTALASAGNDMGLWVDPASVIRFGLKADASLLSAHKGDYLNSLEANIGSYVGGYFADHSNIFEFGFDAKLQADRDFQVVDQTVGLNTYVTLNNRVTAAIGHLFVHRKSNPDDPHGEDYVLPPVLSLGYDFVAHYKNDQTDGGTEVSQNRIIGRLLWEIAVLRGFELPAIILKDPDKRIDADFIADLGATWDLEKSKFLPQVKLDLDFSWSVPNDKPVEHSKRAAFTLTYVNGSSAPKFENVNAFLAGFKLPF